MGPALKRRTPPRQPNPTKDLQSLFLRSRPALSTTVTPLRDSVSEIAHLVHSSVPRGQEGLLKAVMQSRRGPLLFRSSPIRYARPREPLIKSKQFNMFRDFVWAARSATNRALKLCSVFLNFVQHSLYVRKVQFLLSTDPHSVCKIYSLLATTTAPVPCSSTSPSP